MSLTDICALPVGQIAAKDCHLFLWTTQPHLEQSFEVLKAWGFRYSSVHTFWIKLNPRSPDAIWITERDLHRGMGFTTRKNVELVILGRRGSPTRLIKSQLDILIAPRRAHSRKPDSSYSRFEAYCDGPRADLFSRQSREGWDAWGNEAAKFDITAPSPNRVMFTKDQPALIEEPVDPDQFEIPAFLRRLTRP